MKTIAHQNSELHYSPVYLSGLRPLLRIYLEQQAEKRAGNGFGLPLVQACSGKEVVCFSSVHISDTGCIVIRHFSKAGFDATMIREEMEHRAQQELHHSFGEIQDTARMQRQINRLTQWLNNCN